MGLRFSGLVFLVAPLLSATTTINPSGGLSVAIIERTGSYTISAASPGWIFGGSIGRPLTNVARSTGSDNLGAFDQVDFDFQTDALRHAAIRSYYGRTAALFQLSLPAVTAPNSLSFPTFTQYPKGLMHLSWSGMFAHPTFGMLSEDSPWAFFDTAGNTFVISPAANFMTSSMLSGTGGSISSGISSQIVWLPQGFTHQTMLVVDSGINRTITEWGNALTTLTGKTRPANDADASLKSLGYWTDNGATYYYATEGGSSYPATLRGAKADFDRQGIGLGYLQLDSWFYPKGAQADWTDTSDGIYEYFPAAPVFNTSLGTFQQNLGTPLVTHARWIDTSSPYRQQYRMSGGVSTDPQYWTEIARFLAASGVATYEQDWLSNGAQTAFNLTDPDAFLDNMASALAQQGITMQYCMATPRHFMEGAKYGNLTSIRTSEDRFGRSRWTSFVYASRLASAVGIWPYTDVLMSTETDNLLLATLSAGPVGIGDRIGSMSTANLLRSARSDGVIVKPDVPLTPLDSSYMAASTSDGAPLVAATYSDFGAERPSYVFSYGPGAAYHPSELGFNGQVYVFDYFTGAGQIAGAGDTITPLQSDGWSYQVVSPVGISGIAVIGDIGQFVTLGKKRIAALSDDGVVHLTVTFAPGETSRTITGYSPDLPRASAGRLVYDAGSGRFGVTVMPGPAGTTSIDIRRGGAANVHRR
jgi:hypothetical protein